jgi:signal peptidase II
MHARVVKAVVIIAIVLSVVACDQGSKRIARDHLQGRGTVPVVGSVFVLYYTENTGAFLGLGAGLPTALRLVLLVALPVAALAALVVGLLRRASLAWLTAVALSLVAGGGFGNMVDRLFRGGRVSDFMNLGIGSVRTGIFNVADLAIMAGCLLVVLASGRSRPRPA